MRYEYCCDACGHRFEVSESIAAHKERTKCPSCRKNKLYQVYGLAGVIVVGGPTETLGSYAERNTKRVSMDAIAEKEEKAIEAAEKRMGKKAIRKKKGKTPWWRKGPIDRSLAKMTDAQKKKYVMTGKKP